MICFQHNGNDLDLQNEHTSAGYLNNANVNSKNLSNWKLFASGCDGVPASECFFYSKPFHLLSASQNSTDCYTNNIETLFKPNYCYPSNKDCEVKAREYNEILLQNIKIPYLIFGVISLLGNIVVLTQKVLGMIRSSVNQKEVQIYNVLVLNLSIVDCLMGFYVMVLAVSIDLLAVKKTTDHFIGTELCNVLGVINFTSSQISVTCLVIISSFRLWGTIFPYKRVRLKTAYLLIAVMWISWTSIALIPLVNVEPFYSFFSFGVRIEKEADFDLRILQPEILFTNIISSICKTTNHTSCETFWKDIFLSRPVLTTLDMLEISYSNNTALDLGYYSMQSVCSFNLIVDDPYAFPSYFTLSVVVYNLCSFLVILFFYGLIMRSLSRDHKLKHGLMCCMVKDDEKNSAQNVSKKRSQENEAMFRRVFVIVATDFVCWVPICLFSLIFFLKDSFTGAMDCHVSTQFCWDLKLYHAFQTTVCIVVPLNSVINPYIYSFNLWKRLLKRIKLTIR